MAGNSPNSLTMCLNLTGSGLPVKGIAVVSNVRGEGAADFFDVIGFGFSTPPPSATYVYRYTHKNLNKFLILQKKSDKVCISYQIPREYTSPISPGSNYRLRRGGR